MGSKRFLLWRQPTAELASVERFIPVSQRTLTLSDPDGAVAFLAHASGNTILVTDGRPGLWYEVSAKGMSAAKGRDLLGDEKFRRYRDMTVAPGGAAGIVQLSERYVGIVVDVPKFASDGKPSFGRTDFVVFDRISGAMVGKIAFLPGEKIAPVVGRGSAPFEILVASDDPFPRVVRMALRGLQ
jgi:hypothetical protein